MINVIFAAYAAQANINKLVVHRNSAMQDFLDKFLDKLVSKMVARLPARMEPLHQRGLDNIALTKTLQSENFSLPDTRPPPPSPCSGDSSGEVFPDLDNEPTIEQVAVTTERESEMGLPESFTGTQSSTREGLETGTIIKWRRDRNHGWIRADGYFSNKEVYLHTSKIKDEKLGVRPGDRVSYDEEFNPVTSKFEATNVRVIESVLKNRKLNSSHSLATLEDGSDSDEDGIRDRGKKDGIRFRGKVTSWDYKKLIGFITPEGSKDELFFHSNDLLDGLGSVRKHDLVTYVKSKDHRNNKGPRASKVRLADDDPAELVRRRKHG
eukprot:gnl/MRDRNA2_/MRDRNA2_57032_c0_seq1.p1 gnl/MRDRNA2_/MRDRNA2_57032_c0~~gnl/MRDRNA2_/MRDRNA2_57032_c0_seq1.p1  ORF type:complete len:323 (-),score=57.55 gnl/MRDRNA2_/MRDRNA2_57032_c0_seq1:172-1140(-)